MQVYRCVWLVYRQSLTWRFARIWKISYELYRNHQLQWLELARAYSKLPINRRWNIRTDAALNSDFADIFPVSTIYRELFLFQILFIISGKISQKKNILYGYSNFYTCIASDKEENVNGRFLYLGVNYMTKLFTYRYCAWEEIHLFA